MAQFNVTFKDKTNSNIDHHKVEADSLKGAVKVLAGPDTTPWPQTATQIDIRELTV
jgi:hypothetical protein